jgi:RNA polymerase sigma factor for flagellar operon FliA
MAINKDSPEVLVRINEGLSLVPVVARHVRANMGPRADLEELMSCGREALVQAAREYDPQFGHSFRTHAKHVLERAMLDAFRKSMASLPRRAHEHFKAAERDTAAATDSERLRDQHLAAVVTAQAAGVLPQRGHDSQGELLAVLRRTTASQASVRNQERDLINAAVASLPADEAVIIRRHCLDGEPLESVCQELGIPRTTARRLHDRAMERLRKRLDKLH